MTEQNDNDDPMLVRPYIVNQPGGDRPAWAIEPARRIPTYQDQDPAETAVIALPAAQEAAETAVIILPAAQEAAETAVIVLPGAPEPADPPHRPLVLAGLALVLVIAAGLGIALGVGPSAPEAQPAFVAPPSLAVSTPAATSAAPEPAGEWTPAADDPATIPAADNPVTRTPTARAGRTPTKTTPTPSTTLSPVPTVARVGAIRNDGGRCLGLYDGYSFEGSYVQIFDCTGRSGQVWTLATDGTLRVLGMCAQAVDDRTVRTARCDASAAASQWRAGRNESLVHVSTNDCLTTSSGYGYRSAVRVSDCSGKDDQRWHLP